MLYKHLILLLILLASQYGCVNSRSILTIHNDMDVAILGAEISRELIKFSNPPLIPKNSDHPVLILTPVDNDRISDASSFGRALQNAMVAGFVRNGIAVNETKLKNNALIDPEQGEFMLTRDLYSLLTKQQKAQAVVVGTYTLSEDIIYLSVRLVNPKNGQILSVYEQKHIVDENTLQMLGYKVIDDTLITPPRKSFIDNFFY